MSLHLIEPEAPKPDLPPAPILTINLEVGDIVVGLGLLAVAAWFIIQSLAIPADPGAAVGAADFPRGLAALLGAAALALVGLAVRRLAAGRPGHATSIRRPLRVVVGAVLLAAFPAMMTSLGYYPAMAIFLSAFLYLADCRKPLWILANVAGFLAFTKIVFEMILLTPLP